MKILNFLFLYLIIVQFGYSQVNDSIISSTIERGISISDCPDSLYTSIWSDSLYKWENVARYIYIYDDHGNESREVISSWENNNWSQKVRTDYIFYDGNLIRQKHFWWDYFYLEWAPDQRYDLSYDSIDNLSQNLCKKWSEFDESWINDSLFTYEYDTNELLNVFYNYNWSASIEEWENNLRKTYLYDANGNNTAQTESWWEFDLLIWEQQLKNTFAYDTNNRLTVQTQLKANSRKTDWINDWKKDNTYYDNGLIQKEVYYLWLTNIDSWFEDYKFISYYDSDSNLIRKTGYIFDWYHLTWENHFLTENNYYPDRKLTETIYYYWKTPGEWKELERYKYYYPGYNSNRLLVDFNYLNIYPIPTNNNLTVEFKNSITNGDLQFHIYDINGKKVYADRRHVYSNKLEINVTGFNNGIHFLYIKDDKDVYTGKFIVHK